MSFENEDQPMNESIKFFNGLLSSHMDSLKRNRPYTKLYFEVVENIASLEPSLGYIINMLAVSSTPDDLKLLCSVIDSVVDKLRVIKTRIESQSQL